MKLFYSPGSCSMAAHIVLNELGIPYDALKVDLKTKTYNGGESFMAINGKGQVPTIELDDGRRLTEVSSILQYLADLKPDSHLAPANGTFERYQVQEWLSFVATEIHKVVATLFNPALHEEWRQMQTDKISNRLDWLQKQLGNKPYLMGEQFTIADAYLATILNWAKLVKLDMGAWPHLQELLARVMSRPAVVATLKSEHLLR